MSWFRSQIWRQARQQQLEEANQKENSRNTRSRLIVCRNNSNNNNQDDMSHDERSRKIRAGGSTKITNSSGKQTEVRNDNSSNHVNFISAQEQQLSLLVAGRVDEFSSPVASASSVPRLVSMREEAVAQDQADSNERSSCQLINTTKSMFMFHHQAAAAVATTSQLSSAQTSNFVKANFRRRKIQRPKYSNLLTEMLIGTLLGLVLFASLAAGQQRFEAQPELQYLAQNGQEVRLRCLVRSRQGECLWLRNGRAIGVIAKKYLFSRQPEDGDCSLVIRNVSVQLDDGVWQCQVTPSDLEQDTLQSRETQLVVLVPPERPQIKNAVSSSF